MAGKYYQRVDGVDYDVTNLCEAKVDFDSDFNTYFTGEPLQYAFGNTENQTLYGYKNDGTWCAAVKRGYYPYFRDASRLWQSLASGRYNIKRTDTELTISTIAGTSTTSTLKYYSEDFRCNKIPHEFIVLLVGAGGGGGGAGYTEEDKDGNYSVIPGGGGGGGGIVVARISLVDDHTYILVVGAGGAAGANGDKGKDVANTNGKIGSSGGATYITESFSTTAFIQANGGSGGYGGKVEGTAGSGGLGGDNSIGIYGNCNSIKDDHIYAIASTNGGNGNSSGSHYNTTCAGVSFTAYKDSSSDASKPCVIFNIASNSVNGDTANNTAFAGGCSFGCGCWGHYAANAATDGGGGGGGAIKSAGANGYAAIYY